MQDVEYGKLIIEVMNTLEKNGYPKNKVSLGLEKMYEVAHKRGLNFNKVLSFLKEKGTDHEKTTEKIIFFPVAQEGDAEDQAPSDETADLFAGMGRDEMIKKAMGFMRNMTTEQRESIQKMYENMSPQEREEMMKKAKDMKLF